MNRQCRLVFNLKTTRYLGNSKIAEKCINTLSRIPKAYVPTKAEDNNNNKISKFSFDCKNIFLDMIPGKYGNGLASLYKVKGIFGFNYSWHKVSQSYLNNTPGYKFNNITMYSNSWESCLSSENDFKVLESIWMELCHLTDAVYGSISIEDATQVIPRGEGLCLPRLFWKTYLGNEYVKAMELGRIMPDDCFNLNMKSTGAVINLNKKPTELVYPSPFERDIIRKIGEEFFWNEKDDFRKPIYKYRMPELILDEIILN